MTAESQSRAPIYEALKEHSFKRILHFDVPGHKQGKGNPPLVEFLGKQCLNVDVNSMKSLDNLTHPVSVIREAEQLAAEAFGSANAFFMVNGTTSAVQSMIMAVCKQGEKIIMPRNVHRSAINALVISGAVPVYVNPGLNSQLGIPLGMSFEELSRAIKANPDAKAVFVNNPTYYGVCSNIKAIAKLTHENNMYLLADEAHGTHFYFGEGLPVSAMAAGADIAAVSMHKTGGSLTQSSFLVSSGAVNPGYLRQIINLTQTTSGSYLLLSSLDISRRELALNGKKIFDRVASLAEYAREEVNKIGGYYAFSRELRDNDSFYDFDITKLSVNTLELGLAGVEVYDILRDYYDIQIEFGDIANFLAVVSVGDSKLAIERLVSALSEIKRLYAKDKTGMFDHEYISPIVEMTPMKAFYSEKRSVKLAESIGSICGEFVMCYPPGIPILAPGERITREIIDYIEYARSRGSFLTGTQDLEIRNILIVE